MTDRDYSDLDRLEDLEAAVGALEEKCERYAKALDAIFNEDDIEAIWSLAWDALWPRASGSPSLTDLAA